MTNLTMIKVTATQVTTTHQYKWSKTLFLGLSIGFLSMITPITKADEASNAPAVVTPAAAMVELDAFPSPDTDYERHVIRLPVGNYENNLKIELLPGKVQEVDCNPTHYSGLLEEKTLEGWGYSYYKLSDVTGPLSTKMACPDSENTLQFIPVVSTGSLLEYNSRLPVVVYLPKGFELRWRTWAATPYNTADTK